MYITIPEILEGNIDKINRHARHMHINTVKNAVSFLKHMRGLILHGGGRRYVERYKSFNTLISYNCTPSINYIEVHCDKIPKDTDFMVKYISYLVR